MIGNEQGSYLRLYMVNEDQAEGIGIQRVKQSAADPNCLQGSVRYYLWSGQSQELDADYCTCLDAQGGPVTSPGRCPERP